jgi:hypothetical protein
MNKEIESALKSDNPAKSMFQLIPEDKRKSFMKFAKKFGFTEEKIKKLINV